MTYVDSFDNTVFSGSPVATAHFIPVGSLLGDVDLSGEVTSSDAILALRYAMGIIELSPDQLAAGDVNGDGAVGVDDALTILRTAMGLIGQNQ